MTKGRIIGIIVAIIFLAGLGYKAWEYKHPKPKSEVTQSTSSENSVNPASSTTTSTASDDGFRVHKQVPEGGTRIGVIEVGASGFNCFVVKVDKNKNWELEAKEFGESLAYEGFMTSDDAKKGISKYLTFIFDRGVAGKNAHFVMSSGALKNPKTEEIAKAIEARGYVVNRVTAEQEGKYALKALISPEYRSNSFTVDIGSGNTKVSWYEGDRPVSFEASGAKYAQKGLSDTQVSEEISNLVKKVPAANRENMFIIGGAPFTLAKETRTGDERFTLLKNPDDYSAGDNVKLKSGLVIYKALYTGSGCKHVIFDWDANFTIGFLLTLN